MDEKIVKCSKCGAEVHLPISNGRVDIRNLQTWCFTGGKWYCVKCEPVQEVKSNAS